MARPAALFVSHGSPMIAIERTPTANFLRDLGGRLPRPAAVLAVSAHWETPGPALGAAAAPATVHDFAGFPPALSALRYPAPGAPDLARRIAGLLGPETRVDPGRGLDHGIWTVAGHLWPEADVPIVPMSVQPRRDPRHHHDLGRKLRALAGEDVLVLATGSLTHNLGAYFGRPRGAQAEPWAARFAEWIGRQVEAGGTEALLDYRRQAPHAEANHPTDEHLLPLFVALGASAAGHGTVLHRDIEHGVLAMDAFGFA